MVNWLDGIAGPDYTWAILWTIAALVLLVIVLVIVKLIRSMTFGTFVAGGRNRKTRLAVMDATAVDSHRRLVLVRRDDIEHLLLIGGPTDVVVERDIRMVAPRRPAMTGEGGQHPVPAQPSRQGQNPVRRPSPPNPAAMNQPPAPRTSDVHAPRPPDMAALPAVTTNPPPPAHSVSNTAYARPNAQKQPPVHDDGIDDAFMNELEASLDAFSPDHPPAQPKPSQKATLDDEMTKLLGELSNHNR